MIALALAVWTASGFSGPASVAYDEASAALYVSNSGAGTVSKLDLSGKVLKNDWVAGLRSPKGLAACGGKLFVASGDELAVVGLAKGKIEKRVKAPRAVSLEDVAVDGKCVPYASDASKNAIYRFASDGLVWLDGPALDSPRGLRLEGGRLVSASGKLQSYDLATKKLQVMNGPAGGLVGLERHKTWWLATDQTNGTLLRSAPNGVTTVVLHGLEEPADILVLPAKGWLLLPERKKGTLSAYKLSEVAP